MKKLYLLLFTGLLFFVQAMAQSTCTVTSVEFKDEITWNPFAHHIKFTAAAHSSENKIIKKVCWYFGDGTSQCKEAAAGTTTETLLTITHTYGPTSTPLFTYKVCVAVYFDGGCVAEKCLSMPLQSPNTATCSAGIRLETAQDNPQRKYLIALPENSLQKKPLQVCWKFGDGSPDECHTYASIYTGTYVTDHTYPQTGQYEACVVIKYDGGCEARKCTLVSLAGTTTATCSVGIRQETAQDNPKRKYIIALPENSLQKKPLQVCWKFGDGTDNVCKTYASTYTGTYAVDHVYPAAGIYEACVEIKYDGGCEAHKCMAVTVAGTMSTTCAAGVRFESLASSQYRKAIFAVPENSDHKKPLEICWKFGDGTDNVCKTYAATYTGTYAVEHTFPGAGPYEVCVTIKYDGGCEAKKCTVFKLENTEPACAVKLFEVAASVNNLERKFYIGLADGKVAEKICWNFGDGSTATCTTFTGTPTQENLMIGHAFPGPGVYRVCAKVTYTGACTAEKCLEVVIRPRDVMMCGGYMTQTITQPKTVVFHGFSIDNPNDHPVSFNWTFGDGTSGSGKEIKHEFATAGAYQVCLFIKMASGCETRICKRIEVEGGTQSQLILTPNPVVSTLHAQFYSTKAENVNIKIFNSNGLLVKSFTKAAAHGVNNWDFELGTLPTGAYSMIVQSGFQFATALFFKQ
jgi:PKD repeat protein